MMNQTMVLLLILCFSFVDTFGCSDVYGRTRDVDGADEEIHVGVIVDMGSWQGKVIESCISMAISDFYSLQKSYKMRVVIHSRDSQGDPFRALSAALNLWENVKVRAIFGGLTSLESKFLAEFGDTNKIPVISFSKPSSFPPSTRSSPFFVQVGDDQTTQVKGVAALIELYKWKNVILIHEELKSNDFYDDDTISYMAAFFQEKNIHISFTCAIGSSSEDEQIIEQLRELKTLQTSVFIVHLPHSLASRLFVNGKRLGLMSKGYAWIVTSKSMNHFDLRDSSTIQSLQGVVGFRSYIPRSRELDNFTSRLARTICTEAPAAMQYLGYLAYDSAWSLAKAAGRASVQVPYTSAKSGLDVYTTSMYGAILVQEILRSDFKGLGGEFRFINGKLISNTFEIVNVIRSGETRAGFCTSTGRITRETYESNHRRRLFSTNNLDSIVWPGGSLTNPSGRMLQTSHKILKIGVPVTSGFPQLVKLSRDPRTNESTVTGFCIDVFQAAIEGLNNQFEYEFIPFTDANGMSAGTYNDLVHQVYLENFDGAVGDITITARRSLYVDFTIPYTDIGIGIVAPNKNVDMWIFSKPLTPQLWLTFLGYHIVMGFIIWLVEHQTPGHSVDGGLPLERNGFPFSMLVGRWEHLRNKWSIFIAAVSLFVLFIVMSSYTANLASMMTVQHIELNSKRSNIGYQAGSPVTLEVLTSNLNFEGNGLQSFHTVEEFADALSKGSKNGGISALLDELPYIKIFLAQYSADYSLIKTLSTTNGFAFVFPKGSPLAGDISREIARLRESERLNMLENEWFKSQISVTSGDKVGPLEPKNFGGLFLISGSLSMVAFLISQLPLLYKYCQVLGIRMMDRLRLWMQLHLLVKIFRRIGSLQSAAIHPQPQITSTNN